MAALSTRRYYLLKRRAADARGDHAMASGWRGKQLAEPGTALAADLPGYAKLVAAGYVADADVIGADVEELRDLGLTRAQATAALAALEPA